MSDYNIENQSLRPRDVGDFDDRRDPNFEERRSLLKYFRAVWPELKKVVWPNRSQTVNYSIVVFLMLVLMLGIILVLDSAFSDGAVFFFR